MRIRRPTGTSASPLPRVNQNRNEQTCITITSVIAPVMAGGATLGVVVWVDTRTEVTAQAWRAPRGDSVRSLVAGRLAGGASVLVYRGLWGTHRGLGADLAPDATPTILLPTLPHAATIEETRA